MHLSRLNSGSNFYGSCSNSPYDEPVDFKKSIYAIHQSLALNPILHLLSASVIQVLQGAHLVVLKDQADINLFLRAPQADGLQLFRGSGPGGWVGKWRLRGGHLCLRRPAPFAFGGFFGPLFRDRNPGKQLLGGGLAVWGRLFLSRPGGEQLLGRGLAIF